MFLTALLLIAQVSAPLDNGVVQGDDASVLEQQEDLPSLVPS